MGAMSQTFMYSRARLVPRALSGSFSRLKQLCMIILQKMETAAGTGSWQLSAHLHSCILRRYCRKHEQVIDFAKLACKSLRLNGTVVNHTSRRESCVTETSTALTVQPCRNCHRNCLYPLRQPSHKGWVGFSPLKTGLLLILTPLFQFTGSD